MKVLRIKLRQPSVAYTVEEMVNNKMSYPLPTFSSVIGAMHNICGYTEYKDMKLSIQGKYSSRQRKIYTNNAVIDTLHDDRGHLIWLNNPNYLTAGYTLVAKALKQNSNSFEHRNTISVIDEEKLKEYIYLRKLNKELSKISEEKIKPLKTLLKERKKYCEQVINEFGKDSKEHTALLEEIDSIKKEKDLLEKEHKERETREYKQPISHFKTLTKSPQTYEVLYDVELVIHIAAEETILNDIIDNKNNFVSLGRSEDFIELEEMKKIDITDIIDDEYKISNGYSMYVNLQRVDDKTYYRSCNEGKSLLGTVYYVSKKYNIDKKSGRRVFERIPCLFTSNIEIDEESTERGVYIDKEGDTVYLVDLN